MIQRRGRKRRLQSRQVRWGLNSSSDLHGGWDDWEAGKEPDVRRGPQGKVPLSCPPLCCRGAFSTPSGPAWRGQCCCGAVFSLARAGSRQNPTEREIASSGRTGASGVATAQLDGTPWELRLCWSDQVWAPRARALAYDAPLAQHALWPAAACRKECLGRTTLYWQFGPCQALY